MGVASSMHGIPAWFCCIPAAERSILRSCAQAFVLSVGLGIPCLVYDSFWLTVLCSRDARKTAFLSIYGLTPGEVVIPPSPEPICVYTFEDSAFWIALAAFILTPSAACLDGCDQWRPA